MRAHAVEVRRRVVRLAGGDCRRRPAGSGRRRRGGRRWPPRAARWAGGQRPRAAVGVVVPGRTRGRRRGRLRLRRERAPGWPARSPCSDAAPANPAAGAQQRRRRRTRRRAARGSTSPRVWPTPAGVSFVTPTSVGTSRRPQRVARGRERVRRRRLAERAPPARSRRAPRGPARHQAAPASAARTRAITSVLRSSAKGASASAISSADEKRALRIARERLVHDGGEPVGHVGPQRLQRLRVGREDLEEDLGVLAGLGRVRRPAGEKLVEDGAHRVEVGAVVDVARASAPARATCRAACRARCWCA